MNYLLPLLTMLTALLLAGITVTVAKHTAGTGPFPSYLVLVVLGGP